MINFFRSYANVASLISLPVNFLQLCVNIYQKYKAKREEKRIKIKIEGWKENLHILQNSIAAISEDIKQHPKKRAKELKTSLDNLSQTIHTLYTSMINELKKM